MAALCATAMRAGSGPFVGNDDFARWTAAESSARAAGGAAMIEAMSATTDNKTPEYCRARRGADEDSIKAGDAVSVRSRRSDVRTRTRCRRAPRFRAPESRK